MIERPNPDEEHGTPSDGEMEILVIGGGRFGLALASNLADRAGSVTFVDDGPDLDGEAGDVDVVPNRVSDASDIEQIGDEVGRVDAVVVAGSDSQALLSGHLASRELDPHVVVALLSDPQLACAFDEAEIVHVDTAALFADEVRDRLDMVPEFARSREREKSYF